MWYPCGRDLVSNAFWGPIRFGRQFCQSRLFEPHARRLAPGQQEGRCGEIIGTLHAPRGGYQKNSGRL
jgi:hypothetical protein